MIKRGMRKDREIKSVVSKRIVAMHQSQSFIRNLCVPAETSPFGKWDGRLDSSRVRGMVRADQLTALWLGDRNGPDPLKFAVKMTGSLPIWSSTASPPLTIYLAE
jgi:hypothetical protein